MSNTKTTQEAPAETKVKLEVRSKSDKGFFRAGHHFGPTPVEVEVSPEDAERIRNEPQLLVRGVGAGTTAPIAPAPIHVTPEPGLTKPTLEPTPTPEATDEQKRRRER